MFLAPGMVSGCLMTTWGGCPWMTGRMNSFQCQGQPFHNQQCCSPTKGTGPQCQQFLRSLGEVHHLPVACLEVAVVPVACLQKAEMQTIWSNASRCLEATWKERRGLITEVIEVKSGGSSEGCWMIMTSTILIG